MTNGQLCDMLVSQAQKFRDDRGWFQRNAHMHGLPEERHEVPQEIVDAVLTGFINRVATECCGMDLALYAKDLFAP